MNRAPVPTTKWNFDWYPVPVKQTFSVFSKFYAKGLYGTGYRGGFHKELGLVLSRVGTSYSS